MLVPQTVHFFALSRDKVLVLVNKLFRVILTLFSQTSFSISFVTDTLVVLDLVLCFQGRTALLLRQLLVLPRSVALAKRAQERTNQNSEQDKK